MNYLIWKGIDSRNIKGLVVCELPPISKPNMRVAETTIDGMDGSIIEELGYESYDKSLVIGLTQDADINAVISYFTGEGEVVFSNESDKCYKAKIFSRIDFARLARFKTATVTFRVQPFKYEYLEKQVILSSGEIAGVIIQIADKKITRFAIEGESTQNGIPTPATPIEIESIMGDIVVKCTDGSTETTSTIPLTAPLRSVPSGVKDIAYINHNKLYIERCIKSISLNGTENWSVANTIDANKKRFSYKPPIYAIDNTATVNCLSNKLAGMPSNSTGTYGCNEGVSAHRDIIYIYLKDIQTLDNFKNWLTQNPIKLDYAVLNKTTEEIGEASIFGTTVGEYTITNSANANMVVSYTDKELIVTNSGNIGAKPVIEIKGAGSIEFAVNGNKLFRYTFPEGEDTVIIDSQKQDAYLGTNLKNRNMVGEFPEFSIGENIITWEGAIDSITISQKSRWL